MVLDIKKKLEGHLAPVRGWFGRGVSSDRLRKF
jgi:hypothetical protein